MRDIADLAEYCASLPTPTVEAKKLSPTNHAKENNDEQNASSVRSGDVCAIMNFGKDIISRLVYPLLNSRSVIDELSPHIQRDIGLIDWAQPNRHMTWIDPSSAREHWLRRL